ncbi:VOC family protein [Streptomyces sp. V4-01]|uniref:VOC family protein n=1 Tax=Actinacidiphila polyblastidii TaxID=3110430 RepID=A0ABU7PEP7_9ACTN|nr:VOC family protein [Streptomyces sp. V4-01]
MIGKLSAVALDCPDPKALAAFYAEVVGGTVEVEAEEWVELRHDGDGPHLAFQLAPDHRPPVWRDPARPQQLHLDVKVARAEMDAAEQRVLELGATLLEGDHDGARNWRVYADPAGHPFCLCAC